MLIFSGGGGEGSQGGGGGQEPHRWGVPALVRYRELVAHFAELAFWRAVLVARSLGDQIFEGVVMLVVMLEMNTSPNSAKLSITLASFGPCGPWAKQLELNDGLADFGKQFFFCAF